MRNQSFSIVSIFQLMNESGLIRNTGRNTHIGISLAINRNGSSSGECICSQKKNRTAINLWTSQIRRNHANTACEYTVPEPEKMNENVFNFNVRSWLGLSWLCSEWFISVHLTLFHDVWMNVGDLASLIITVMLNAKSGQWTPHNFVHQSDGILCVASKCLISMCIVYNLSISRRTELLGWVYLLAKLKTNHCKWLLDRSVYWAGEYCSTVWCTIRILCNTISVLVVMVIEQWMRNWVHPHTIAQ